MRFDLGESHLRVRYDVVETRHELRFRDDGQGVERRPIEPGVEPSVERRPLGRVRSEIAKRPLPLRVQLVGAPPVSPAEAGPHREYARHQCQVHDALRSGGAHQPRRRSSVDQSDEGQLIRS